MQGMEERLSVVLNVDGSVAVQGHGVLSSNALGMCRHNDNVACLVLTQHHITRRHTLVHNIRISLVFSAY